MASVASVAPVASEDMVITLKALTMNARTQYFETRTVWDRVVEVYLTKRGLPEMSVDLMVEGKKQLEAKLRDECRKVLQEAGDTHVDEVHLDKEVGYFVNRHETRLWATDVDF